jgi:hypothetical protein
VYSHNSSILKSFRINNFENAHTTFQFWQVSQLIVCRTIWATEITNVSNKNILNFCYNELINCIIELIFRVSVQVDFWVGLLLRDKMTFFKLLSAELNEFMALSKIKILASLYLSIITNLCLRLISSTLLLGFMHGSVSVEDFQSHQLHN